MAKKLAVKQPKILRYEELEQRVLFSADAVPGLEIDGVHEQVLTEEADADPPAAPGERGQAAEQTDEATGPELVLVNGNVADYEQLIATLKESNDDRTIEVVVLTPHEDGIGQVTQTLAGRSDLSAVHFITHGADGQINLGNTWLNSTALEQNSHAVAQWGNALAETGDLLFYGCNIAGDSDGQNLLGRISQLTGADVAASDDMTGNSEQGGDWDLEYSSGPVETELSVRSDPQPGWSHLLNVNQGPVNTVPGPQSITQNGMVFFSFSTGTKISISDPDAGDNPVQVTLTATNGTLNLSGKRGLTFTDGSGTADVAMTFTGTISDINTAMKGMTFAATPGFTGTAGVELTTNDLGQTGTGGGLTATSNITITVAPDPNDSLWLSTFTDGDADGFGLNKDEIIRFSNPNFSLSPDTNGTFTSIADFNANINALHHVTRNLKIGGSIYLRAGDILFSTDTDYTIGGLDVTNKDVVLFHPDTPGDYSSGTFTILLEDPGTGTEIRGLTLVQQETTVGSTTPETLNPGDFLFILEDESIYRYVPTTAGAGSTAGDLTVFIHGASGNVRINQPLNSIHLIERDTTLGGVSVGEGDLLATMNADDPDLGKNGIAVEKYDIFRLDVESTGVGTSSAQASLLFDGSDVAVNADGEEPDALTQPLNSEPPQIIDDTFTINEHSPVDEFVGNVTHIGLELPLSYAIIAGNDGGGFEIVPDAGQINVANSAALDFETTPTIVLTVAAIDGQGVYDTATITIELSDINDPPIIENNTGVTVVKGSMNNVITTAMLNTSDHEDPAANLTYTLTTPVGKGALKLIDEFLVQWDTFTQADIDTGKLIYDHGDEDTLDGGFSFTVEDTDEEQPNTLAGTFTIRVNAPQINDLTASVADDAPNDTVVADINDANTGNDTDPNGNPLTYSITAGNGDGFFTIDPGTGIITIPDTSGLDHGTTPSYALTVEVTDGSRTDTATVTVNITGIGNTSVGPVSDSNPAGNTVAESANVGATAGITAVAMDQDPGDTVTYSLTNDAGGRFAIGSGTGVVTVAGNIDYDAADSHTITVQAESSDGSTSSRDFTITIVPVNNPPRAGNAMINGPEDSVFRGKLPTATDPDGDRLTYALERSAGNGSAAVNSNGSFSYTPNPDFNGMDSFTYTVRDGQGGTDTATVTITITPVNDTPMAVDAGFNTLEDTVFDGTLPRATDPDGDPLTYSLASAPGKGSCVVNPDGSFSYTPAPDVNGMDSFTYTASDGHGGTDTATVAITITPVNDMPMAADAEFNTLEDTVFDGNLPAATDPDGDPLTYSLAGAPGKGSCVVNPDGSFSYSPSPDVNGMDSFTYTVRDDYGGTDTATVTMTITPVNDMPMVADAGFNTLEDTVFDGNLPAATDPDGDPLTYTLASAPGKGACVVRPDGSFSYTPNPDVNGMDTFTYTVSDGKGGTDTATATMEITPVSDVPMAANASFNGREDTVCQGNLPQSSDPDGDPVTYTLENAATKGTCVVNPDGSFDYTPNPDINGMDTFTYTVSDGTGNSSTYTVNIHVAPVKDIPTFTWEPVTEATEATEATPYSSTITTGNVDGTPLTLSATTLPAWLTLVDNGDGTATLSGTPIHADKGDHRVGIEVSNDGLTNTLNFNINVFVTTNGVTGSEPGQVFNDPETNTGEEPAEKEQTPEKTASAPFTEDKTMPPAKAPPVTEASTGPEHSTVPVKESMAETTDKPIDQTHEPPMDTHPKNRGEDRSPVYFDNDLYREISSLKYSNFNYTAGKNPSPPMAGDEFTSLDFNDNDHTRIDMNRDYDLMRRQMDQSFNSELKSMALKTKLLTITSATFTMGIVSYLLRAGSLVASLISSLPVWWGFDPIAVFSKNKNKPTIKPDDISDADELKAESIFDGDPE